MRKVVNLSITRLEKASWRLLTNHKRARKKKLAQVVYFLCLCFSILTCILCIGHRTSSSLTDEHPNSKYFDEPQKESDLEEWPSRNLQPPNIGLASPQCNYMGNVQPMPFEKKYKRSTRNLDCMYGLGGKWTLLYGGVRNQMILPRRKLKDGFEVKRDIFDGDRFQEFQYIDRKPRKNNYLKKKYSQKNNKNMDELDEAYEKVLKDAEKLVLLAKKVKNYDVFIKKKSNDWIPFKNWFRSLAETSNKKLNYLRKSVKMDNKMSSSEDNVTENVDEDDDEESEEEDLEKEEDENTTERETSSVTGLRDLEEPGNGTMKPEDNIEVGTNTTMKKAHQIYNLKRTTKAILDVVTVPFDCNKFGFGDGERNHSSAKKEQTNVDVEANYYEDMEETDEEQYLSTSVSEVPKTTSISSTTSRQEMVTSNLTLVAPVLGSINISDVSKIPATKLQLPEMNNSKLLIKEITFELTNSSNLEQCKQPVFHIVSPGDKKVETTPPSKTTDISDKILEKLQQNSLETLNKLLSFPMYMKHFSSRSPDKDVETQSNSFKGGFDGEKQFNSTEPFVTKTGLTEKKFVKNYLEESPIEFNGKRYSIPKETYITNMTPFEEKTYKTKIGGDLAPKYQFKYSIALNKGKGLATNSESDNRFIDKLDQFDFDDGFAAFLETTTPTPQFLNTLVYSEIDSDNEDDEEDLTKMDNFDYDMYKRPTTISVIDNEDTTEEEDDENIDLKADININPITELFGASYADGNNFRRDFNETDVELLKSFDTEGRLRHKCKKFKNKNEDLLTAKVSKVDENHLGTVAKIIEEVREAAYLRELLNKVKPKKTAIPPREIANRNRTTFFSNIFNNLKRKKDSINASAMSEKTIINNAKMWKLGKCGNALNRIKNMFKEKKGSSKEEDTCSCSCENETEDLGDEETTTMMCRVENDECENENKLKSVKETIEGCSARIEVEEKFLETEPSPLDCPTDPPNYCTEKSTFIYVTKGRPVTPRKGEYTDAECPECGSIFPCVTEPCTQDTFMCGVPPNKCAVCTTECTTKGWKKGGCSKCQGKLSTKSALVTENEIAKLEIYFGSTTESGLNVNLQSSEALLEKLKEEIMGLNNTIRKKFKKKNYL